MSFILRKWFYLFFMKNISFFLLSLASTLLGLHAQGFMQQFATLHTQKDTAAQRLLLQKWEQTTLNDPDLYVAYFNYYVSKAEHQVIELGQNPEGKEALRLTQQDAEGKEVTAGFMYGGTFYQPDLVAKGIVWVRKGIELFPTRLDMRFGEAYMYTELKQWDSLTSVVIKTIDYGNTINNKWLWRDGEAMDDGKEAMLSSIQRYQYQMYQTGEDSLLENTRQISETILKYYPDHVESISNISVYYLLKENFDKALELMKKAEQYAPKDPIILGNIAYVYKHQNNIKMAILYYKKVIKYGDAESKDYAKEQLTKLKQ